MWKQAFLAEERIGAAFREAERNRVANKVRSASRFAAGGPPYTMLNRVASHTSDMADRVVRVVRSWKPAAGSAA